MAQEPRTVRGQLTPGGQPYVQVKVHGDVEKFTKPDGELDVITNDPNAFIFDSRDMEMRGRITGQAGLGKGETTKHSVRIELNQLPTRVARSIERGNIIEIVGGYPAANAPTNNLFGTLFYGELSQEPLSMRRGAEVNWQLHADIVPGFLAEIMPYSDFQLPESEDDAPFIGDIIKEIARVSGMQFTSIPRTLFGEDLHNDSGKRQAMRKSNYTPTLPPWQEVFLLVTEAAKILRHNMSIVPSLSPGSRKGISFHIVDEQTSEGEIAERLHIDPTVNPVFSSTLRQSRRDRGGGTQELTVGIPAELETTLRAEIPFDPGVRMGLGVKWEDPVGTPGEVKTITEMSHSWDTRSTNQWRTSFSGEFFTQSQLEASKEARIDPGIADIQEPPGGS